MEEETLPTAVNMEGGPKRGHLGQTFVKVCKVFAIISNILMSSVGAYGFYLGFHTFNSAQQVDAVLVLISLYMAVAGLLGLGGELKARVLFHKFGFLSSRMGRACFYMIMGSLATVQGIQTAYCTAFVEDMPSCPAPFCTPNNASLLQPYGEADQCRDEEICYKNGCFAGCSKSNHNVNEGCKDVSGCIFAVPATNPESSYFNLNNETFFVCEKVKPLYMGDSCAHVAAPCIAGTSCDTTAAFPKCIVVNDKYLNPMQSRCCAFVDKEKFTLAAGCVQMLAALGLILSYGAVPSGGAGQYHKHPAAHGHAEPLLAAAEANGRGSSPVPSRGSDDSGSGSEEDFH